MSPVNQQHPLAGEASQVLEELVRRFESAWQSGRSPTIEEYLPAGPADRRAVLLELIHADLEFRLKAGEPVRVEAYLERYADLARDPDAVLGLAQAEYRQRCRSEAGLTPGSLQEFLARLVLQVMERGGPIP